MVGYGDPARGQVRKLLRAHVRVSGKGCRCAGTSTGHFRPPGFKFKFKCQASTVGLSGGGIRADPESLELATSVGRRRYESSGNPPHHGTAQRWRR